MHEKHEKKQSASHKVIGSSQAESFGSDISTNGFAKAQPTKEITGGIGRESRIFTHLFKKNMNEDEIIENWHKIILHSEWESGTLLWVLKEAFFQIPCELRYPQSRVIDNYLRTFYNQATLLVGHNNHSILLAFNLMCKSKGGFEPYLLCPLDAQNFTQTEDGFSFSPKFFITDYTLVEKSKASSAAE